ncbi:MAG: hypothetical protein LBV75_08085 [Paludibacter sp.]|jgi:hypothetical protein|nr:hypothetical protein [Paludibacter sp.]
MKKTLLITLVAVATLFSVNAQNRTWDFTGTWSIDATTVDANLSLDGTTRFNYVPATTLAELVFSSGQAIADVANLKFTQGGASKLRLGFATDPHQLYLNGKDITVEIPSSVGDVVTIYAKPGSNDATDRGFSSIGGTLTRTAGGVNTSGIQTTAAGAGEWEYTVTSVPFSIKSVIGGMNIQKITVSSTSAVSTPTSVKAISSVFYFNALGAQVDATAKGLVIVKTKYADGTSAVEKLYRSEK